MKKFIRTKSFLFFLLPIILIFFFSFHLLWGGESKEKEKNTDLIWYRYDLGLKKAEKGKKHLLLYFYTKYCGYCRKMEKNTFSDQRVKEILNDNYVSVRVDAGSRNKVKFDGSQITERELALKYRVRGYPSNWFLKPDGEKIAPVIGYIDPKKFLYILEYVKDDTYEKMSFSEYMKRKKREE